jgi:hypothetical protein
MLDKGFSFLSLIVIGGIAIRIITNKNSASVIGTVFTGVAEDISASFG